MPSYLPTEITDQIVSLLIPQNWNFPANLRDDDGDENYGVCDMFALRLIDGRFNDIVCRQLFLKADLGVLSTDLPSMSVGLVASFLLAKHDSGLRNQTEALQTVSLTATFLKDLDAAQLRANRFRFYFKAAFGATVSERGMSWASTEMLTRTRPQKQTTSLSQTNPPIEDGCLSVAAYFGDEFLVKKMLERNHDPNERHSLYGYPMYAACCGGHLNVIRLLMEVGIEKTLSENLGCFGCPAEIAAREGHFDVLKFLAKEQAHFGFALTNAIISGHTDMADWLIQRPVVNVNAPRQDGVPLLLAIERNFHSTVRLLCLRRDLRPNVKDETGQLPLHKIVRTGWINVAQLLLEHKHCDPNLNGDSGNTPLHTACKHGRRRMARLLLSQKRVNPNKTNNLQDTPLCTAIRYKHFSTAREVLKSDRVNASLGNARNKPLEVCILNDDEATLQALLKRPEVRADKPGLMRALGAAMRKDKVNTVQQIVDLGPLDLNRLGLDGMAPLQFAVSRYATQVAKFLLSLPEVDPNQLNAYHESGLMIAAHSKQEDTLQAFLDCPRVDVNIIGTNGPALTSAMLNNAFESMRMILTRPDVDPNIQSPSGPVISSRILTTGNTPLVFAARCGLVEATKILLEHPVTDVNRPDKRERRTPLGWAAQSNHASAASVISVLLKHTAIEPNKEDSDGYTPLLRAVSKKRLENVKCLLQDPKVDPNGKPHHEWAPLQLAIELNSLSIAEELLKHPRIDAQQRNTDPNRPFTISLTPVQQAYRLRRQHFTELIHRYHPSLEVDPHMVQENYRRQFHRNLYQVDPRPAPVWPTVHF